jgi:RNA polymerase sigma-70 factor (ECF subfamily)
MPPPDFQSLVDRHYEALFRFGFSLAGNRNDACDLTQQTFFIWARQGHRLRDAAKAKSWLFTTLYREFLKLHRHSRRLTLVEEPELDAEQADIDPDWIGSLDGATVLEALNSVDEVYRGPLTLFYLQELSYKEIADVLGVPIGTVMSRLSRGKDQLRRILNQRTDATDGKLLPWTARNTDTSPSAAPPQPREARGGH